MPNSFSIATFRDPAAIGGWPVHAMVLQNYSHSKQILPFVQGPAATDTEGALRALLEKVEGMTGKRWKVTAELRRMHYLET